MWQTGEQTKQRKKTTTWKQNSFMHRRNNFRFSCGCGFDCGGVQSRGCGCWVVSNDQIICLFVGKTLKLKLQLN